MATTFNRYEKKYIIPVSIQKKLLKEIKPYMQQDSFQTSSYYTICNVYYDNIDDEIIKRSVSKPIFKEKLRLRSYLSDNDNGLMYLEIKKKVNGFVNKRRTFITEKDANMLIFEKVMPLKKEYHNLQVLNEIYYYVLNKTLYPKIHISYERSAYFEVNNPDFRLTFDNSIMSRRTDVSLQRNEFDHCLLDEDYVLMELKTSTAIPLWMSKILTKYQLYSHSFSKYGSEFLSYLLSDRKENELCLNPYLTYQVRP